MTNSNLVAQQCIGNIIVLMEIDLQTCYHKLNLTEITLTAVLYASKLSIAGSQPIYSIHRSTITRKNDCIAQKCCVLS